MSQWAKSPNTPKFCTTHDCYSKSDPERLLKNWLTTVLKSDLQILLEN